MDTFVDGFAGLENKLAELANAQFESPEYKRLFSLKWTRERARIYMMQRSYFVLNRRDCWAYLQGSVPFDVKQIIWDHEKEELMGDDARGVENHWALGMREGAVLGLSPEDFAATPPLPGTVACCYAWIHIAKDWPWLKALPVCAATELSNSDAIIAGGSFSRFAGNLHAAMINRSDLLGEPERGELRTIRAKRVCFDDLGAGVDVRLVHPEDSLGLGEIKLFEATL